MIDMEKDMPIPKQEDLHGIAELAKAQVKLTKELAEATSKASSSVYPSSFSLS